MNVCKNCVYWDSENKRRYHSSCDCPKFVPGYHVEDEELTDDSVHVEDDEGWAFRTGENFGCVHFKKKESK
jgi:hypothetical protein